MENVLEEHMLNIIIGAAQGITLFFGKKYFDKLDAKLDEQDEKMNGIETKIDKIREEHHETKTQIREHKLILDILQKK
jgi:hypothetical protein